jgi:hypothetical protein
LRYTEGELLDFIQDNGFGTYTYDQLFQKGMTLAGHLVEGSLPYMKRTPGGESLLDFGESEEGWAKFIQFLGNHPEAVYRDAFGKLSFAGNSETYEEGKRKAKQKAVTMMRVKPENVVVDYEDEGMWDKGANYTITVSGEGKKNGVYKFASDGEKTRLVPAEEDGNRDAVKGLTTEADALFLEGAEVRQYGQNAIATPNLPTEERAIKEIMRSTGRDPGTLRPLQLSRDEERELLEGLPFEERLRVMRKWQEAGVTVDGKPVNLDWMDGFK